MHRSRRLSVSIKRSQVENSLSKNKTAAFIVRWAKRLTVYCAGLFIMALGVVLSVKSALGVSPVTCLANVTHSISGLGLGLCTTASYCLYILAELLILRRDFKPAMLIQIAVSFFFGALVSLATRLLAPLAQPEQYWLRLVYLLCSIPTIALGVMLYLTPQIFPTPGEGLSIAISTKTGMSVASAKMLSDCCMVVSAAALSLVFFRRLVGVREGTVLSALLVGFVMKCFMRLLQPALLRFTERDSKLERAVRMAADGLEASAFGSLIITISREFGSGGYELGKRLAEKLGVEFYDSQLIPLEAAESGLSEEYIRRHEQKMARSAVYDFITAGYAMYNEDLPPQEKLFAAQTKIIRSIAARGESCVIVGRCSDHILYDDPNCFRVFVHAPPEFRAQRVAQSYSLTPEQARQEVVRTDAARRRYYQTLTGRSWGDTKYYNLALDSQALGTDGCLDVLCSALEAWKNAGKGSSY